MVTKLNLSPKAKPPAEAKQSATAKMKAKLGGKPIEEPETEPYEEGVDEVGKDEPAPKSGKKKKKGKKGKKGKADPEAKAKGGINLEAHQAKATTTVEGKDGEVTETVEFVGEVLLTDEVPHNVGVRFGRTVNLGDYNSAKIEVSLHVPCEHDGVEGAYERAALWCQARIEELVGGGEDSDDDAVDLDDTIPF